MSEKEHTFVSERTKQICDDIYRECSKKKPDFRIIAVLKISLLREHMQHITKSGERYLRAESTIRNLARTYGVPA